MIALRYGTPPIVHRDGRPGRHRHRRDDASRAPAPGSSSTRRPSRRCSRRATRRCALRAAGGPPWEGLLDRGMAVDFDWVTGSAPRYVEAYGGRSTIRRAASSAAPRLSRARASRAARRLGRVRPLRRVRGARDGQDVVGADPRRERRQRRVRHVARRSPGRRGRARSGCRPRPGRRGRRGRRPSRRSRGGRARAASSIWVSASALARTSPADQAGFAPPRARAIGRRRGRRRAPRTGPSAIRAMSDSGIGRRIEQDERRRPDPGDRAARPRSSRPSCGRRPGAPGRRARPPGSTRRRRRRCRGTGGGRSSGRSARGPGRSGATTRRPVAASAGPTRHQIARPTPSRRGSGRAAGRRVAPGAATRTGSRRRPSIDRSPGPSVVGAASAADDGGDRRAGTIGMRAVTMRGRSSASGMRSGARPRRRDR